MSDITGLGDCGSNGRWPSGFEVQTLTTVHRHSLPQRGGLRQSQHLMLSCSAPYPGFGLAGGNRRRRADPVQDLRTLHALLRFTGGPAPTIAGGGGSTFIFGALPPPVGVQKESPCCPRSCLAGKKRCPGISQDFLPGEPPAERRLGHSGNLRAVAVRKVMGSFQEAPSHAPNYNIGGAGRGAQGAVRAEGGTWNPVRTLGRAPGEAGAPERRFRRCLRPKEVAKKA